MHIYHLWFENFFFLSHRIMWNQWIYDSQSNLISFIHIPPIHFVHFWFHFFSCCTFIHIHCIQHLIFWLFRNEVKKNSRLQTNDSPPNKNNNIFWNMTTVMAKNCWKQIIHCNRLIYFDRNGSTEWKQKKMHARERDRENLFLAS